MPLHVALGCQFGDEGKARAGVALTEMFGYDLSATARYNGANNAGHETEFPTGSLALHQLPSGVLVVGRVAIIGNGSLLNFEALSTEKDAVDKMGVLVSPANLAISSLAHLILPHHVELDKLRERGAEALHTTKTGISFAAADKYGRRGFQAYQLFTQPDKVSAAIFAGLEEVFAIAERTGKEKPAINIERVHDEYMAAAGNFELYVQDTVSMMDRLLSNGSHVLAEGAQATGLDMELQAFPDGTSSHVGVAGALAGLSVAYDQVGEVLGVTKATKTQVGKNRFVTIMGEDEGPIVELLQGKITDIDGEWGKTTGRRRDIGWYDIPEIRTADMANGLTGIIMNKFDRLNDPRKIGVTETKVAVAYDLDGTKLDRRPQRADEVAACKPVYARLPLWDGDISGIRHPNDLPKEARRYLDFINDQLGGKLVMVGVGPKARQRIEL